MMNEFRSKMQQFGNMPKNNIYEHLLDVIIDNVICYDMRNNYFSFETQDKKTAEILTEAMLLCGHSNVMDSYGHLKFLLSYGFLPLTEDVKNNRIKVDLDNPECVISLTVFGEKGLGYLDVMYASIKDLDMSSELLISDIQKRKDLTTSLKFHAEIYNVIKHNSKIPSHWFEDNKYTISVEDKKTIALKMQNVLDASVDTEDLDINKVAFEMAKRYDRDFFNMCQNIGRELINIVTHFASKIAENKGVSIDLSTVKYNFLDQEEVVKQFFESQYNDSHMIMQSIKNKGVDYKLDDIQDIINEMHKNV